LVCIIQEDEISYNTELLDLRNDFVFRSFFISANYLLIDFLNTILDFKIIKADIINSGLEIIHSDDKFSRLVLKVETENGERINIEIQLQIHEAFPERILMYWAKMYATQDKKGKYSKELNKAIQIIITDFKLLPKSNYYSKFLIIDGEDGTVFSEHLQLYVLELSKLDVNRLDQTNKLEKWLLFLKADKKTKEALALESSLMKDALDEIERISQDPKTVEIASSREFFLKDQLQREVDALNRGREEGKEEVIFPMYELGISVRKIANVTGFSIEKVERVIEHKF